MHQFLKFIFGIKLYMFRTVPLSIVRSFSQHTEQWYMSYRFVESLLSAELIFCTLSPFYRTGATQLKVDLRVL